MPVEFSLGACFFRCRERSGLETFAGREWAVRKTLRAFENGDPASSVGVCLRVLCVLGIGDKLALSAVDTRYPANLPASKQRRNRSMAPRIPDALDCRARDAANAPHKSSVRR